jgi:hypothetical protein
VWTGSRRAHCGAGGCHRTFTSVSAFDRHRARAEDGDIVCVDPLSDGLGLVLREKGMYGYPKMSEEQRAQAFGNMD